LSSGGVVSFHDARAGCDGGHGSPGPTAVVDDVFRAADSGWMIVEEIDSLVVVQRVDEIDHSTPERV